MIKTVTGRQVKYSKHEEKVGKLYNVVGNLWSTIACVIMCFVRPHFVNCVN